MNLSLPLTVKIMPAPECKKTTFVAYCPELDMASCGSTKRKARFMLKEAINIVLKDAKKEGTLDNYLESVGFSIDKKKNKVTIPQVTYEPFSFPIPKFLNTKFACLA